MLWIVDASGGFVSWIVSARDVACCDAVYVNSCIEESVDMLENGIDGSVAMSADAPSFDNVCVVTI